jgi:poly(A) polymerase Pap1
MDWIRLVESRIRFLIQGLEKIPLINLAHINPQGYQEIKERLSSFEIFLLYFKLTFLNNYRKQDYSLKDSQQPILLNSTFWFIGLKIIQNQNDPPFDLNLTEPIQDFTNRG